MGFEQMAGLMLLAMAAVIGVGLMIDGYGGWPIFWYDVTKYFRRKRQKSERRKL